MVRDVAKEKVADKILRILREEGRAMTPKEIAEKGGIKYNTVRGTLYRMVKAGTIEKKGRGLYTA